MGLVELLVAMALGLAVVALVLQGGLLNTRVAAQGAAAARGTDNAATAMALVRAHVALAGRAVARGVELPASAPPRFVRIDPGAPVRACAHGFVQPRAAFDNLACAPASPGAQAALALRWEADATSSSMSAAGLPLDCVGNGTPAAAAASGVPLHWPAEARFYLAVPAGGVRRELYCAVPGSGAAQGLVEGIDEFQVAAALPGPVPGAAPVWHPAPATGAPDWSRVIALRLCIVATSADEPLAEPVAYLNCDGERQLPTDRRLRRMLQAAVPLHQGPGALP
jgi:type IV pilus assembly protein PilW